MKKLVLIRHAKSSWDDFSIPDKDRPLNNRGKKNAPFMAEILREKKIIPELIVSSDAQRARKTAEKMAEILNYKNEIVFESKIYEAETKTLLKIVCALPDTKKTIFLFGHNPGFTDLVNYLADANLLNLPTCGVAVIQFKIDSWKEVSMDTGELIYLDYPKNYPEKPE